MFPALNLEKTHLVNDRSLAFEVKIVDGLVFSGMINGHGDMFYRHLMHRTEDGWITVPVF